MWHNTASFRLVRALQGSLGFSSAACFTLLLTFCFFFCLSCARFRVQELNPFSRFSLDLLPPKAKNPDMKLQILEKEGLAYNFPIRPALSGSRIYLSDAKQKLVRVFDDDEEPLLLLGSRRPSSLPSDSSVKYRQLDLGIPGWIAVDEDTGEIYIQSYAPISPPVKEEKVRLPEKRLSGRQSRIFQSPSFILRLNKKARLIGRIGREGYNSPPFDLILQMHSDKGGPLYVLHKDRSIKELELLVFEKGRLLRRFGMPALDHIDLDLKQKLILLEHIQPVADQDFVIGSLAVRKKNNFQLLERIIYRQSTPEAKARILFRNDNLIDFLVWAGSKGNFYMFQTEESGSEILLKIFSKKGVYLENRSIELPGLRYAWRDTFLDLEGRVFSSRVLQNKFVVYEWK